MAPDASDPDVPLSSDASAAPPRPLDEEESDFLQRVEVQRLEAKQRKEEWEAQELRGFAIARANQTGNACLVFRASGDQRDVTNPTTV